MALTHLGRVRYGFRAMKVDFGWFLPTMGDSEVIGPVTRPASIDYLVDVARADEAGSPCASN
jgi:hypothetical protein